MNSLKQLLKDLCGIVGVSGRENAVSEFITNRLKDIKDVSFYIDNSGNIIANKKGKKSGKNLMVDAHMDEVGFIVTFIEENGLIRFSNVGGIETETLLCKKVLFKNAVGVIGMKPIHLTEEGEKDSLPKSDDLFIDIGAKSKEEALQYVSLGEVATFKSEFCDYGDGLFMGRAVDDRVGCAVLLKLLSEESEYDFTATFTVQEELGCKGAATAAFSVNPEVAIILEGTTAGDILDVAENKKVCKVGCGTAVSFMDRVSIYDRELYELAFKQNVICQPKAYVSGGNNSGSIASAGNGAKVLALSLPTRYLHSGGTIGSYSDVESLYKLTKAMIKAINE